MNVLSLNVQGLGKNKKRRWIVYLCVKHKVNFLTLQEVKKEVLDVFLLRGCGVTLITGMYSHLL